MSPYLRNALSEDLIERDSAIDPNFATRFDFARAISSPFRRMWHALQGKVRLSPGPTIRPKMSIRNLDAKVDNLDPCTLVPQRSGPMSIR